MAIRNVISVSAGRKQRPFQIIAAFSELLNLAKKFAHRGDAGPDIHEHGAGLDNRNSKRLWSLHKLVLDRYSGFIDFNLQFVMNREPGRLIHCMNLVALRFEKKNNWRAKSDKAQRRR